MATNVEATEAPERVLEVAGSFLATDPVRHNVILTLLHTRVAHPGPGRYWIVDVDSAVAGVVFQSPLHFIATITPMTTDVSGAAVDAIVDGGVHLPGVSGKAAAAARFAGQWAERTKAAAFPIEGQRIYEVDRVVPARPVSGQFRQATDDDHDVLVAWFDAFRAEIGESVENPAQVVARRLPAGHLWVWQDVGPVAMAGLSEPVAGVTRVAPVYTPPERRNRGYASALVAAVSAAARSKGLRCILYADLANPTSNSIYRAIGYRAVAEVLRYRFDRRS
jgi:uncharacterized protein